MRKNKKLFALAAVILAVMFAFAGCAKQQKTVLAKVGQGDAMREVTLANLTNYYNNYAAYASYYGIDVSTEEARQSLVDQLFESLVQNAVMESKAVSSGITLTDAEKAEVKAAADADYEKFYQDFVNYAKQQGANDVEVQANKLLTDTLVQNGMTVNSVKAEYLQSETDSKLVEKMQQKVFEENTPSAEELEKAYNDEVASQQEAIEANGTSAYFMQELLADYGYANRPLVIPEGLFRVRHILVNDETVEGKTGEELAKEIKAQIDEGADFEELLKQYNQDTGEDGYPEGYVVGEGANFVEPFLNAALALENEGDVSAPVQSDYGWHIIKRMANVEARTIPYEEIKESFDSMMIDNAHNTAYNELVNSWLNEEGFVTRYNDTTAAEAYKAIAK